jgi:hypothetical protein
MGSANASHHQGYQRRARSEEDQEGHAGPVGEYQTNGTRQHREAADRYRPAIPALIAVPGAWRRVPGIRIMRLDHRASSPGRCGHASGCTRAERQAGHGSVPCPP